jgi:O-acetyl-ADP-ribose deacetylase (regulator of RNase III)
MVRADPIGFSIMAPALIFNDINVQFLREIRRAFNDPVTAKLLPKVYLVKGSVTNVHLAVPAGSVLCYVSPANSLGYMHGGIDGIFSSMFPGIQDAVQTEVAKYGVPMVRNKKGMPIGGCILVPADRTHYLASAPTMWVPSCVKDTNNAYSAFKATLQCIEKYMRDTGARIDAIVCSGLCCGVGDMGFDESANQIRRAYDDFLTGHRDADSTPAVSHVFWYDAYQLATAPAPVPATALAPAPALVPATAPAPAPALVPAIAPAPAVATADKEPSQVETEDPNTETHSLQAQ